MNKQNNQSQEQLSTPEDMMIIEEEQLKDVVGAGLFSCCTNPSTIGSDTNSVSGNSIVELVHRDGTIEHKTVDEVFSTPVRMPPSMPPSPAHPTLTRAQKKQYVYQQSPFRKP